VVQYTGGGGISFCKKCSKELVDFIENLGGTLESTDGCIDESAYITKQQIKNLIEDDMKFSDDVLQKGR
jgi:hypothetical protein